MIFIVSFEYSIDEMNLFKLRFLSVPPGEERILITFSRLFFNKFSEKSEDSPESSSPKRYLESRFSPRLLRTKAFI